MECSMCDNSTFVYLGTMGLLEYFSCRACGWEARVPVATREGDEVDLTDTP